MEQDQGSTAIENTQEYLITKDKKAKYTFRMKNPAVSYRVSNQNLPSLDGRGLRGG